MKWLWDVAVSLIPAWDWKEVFAKNGFATIAAVFLAVYFVLPAREDQKRFIDSVIETNQLRAATEASNAKTLNVMSDSHARQTTLLNQNAETLKRQTVILQEIRDDARRALHNP